MIREIEILLGYQQGVNKSGIEESDKDTIGKVMVGTM
jgi:hypothetical protein